MPSRYPLHVVCQSGSRYRGDERGFAGENATCCWAHWERASACHMGVSRPFNVCIACGPMAFAHFGEDMDVVTGLYLYPEQTLLRKHLSAPPAGQREPGSLTHRAPNTTHRPSWHPAANVGHPGAKCAGCGVTAMAPARSGCDVGTASAEGCVWCGRISEHPAGARSPVPGIGRRRRRARAGVGARAT
jgi:hypothetical protein